MPGLNDIKTVSDKVLSSKTLQGAPTSSALLKYLVQATLKKEAIKESTIGLELFGKKYAGVSSDARIRVNIYHLRKKLDKYYETEGKQDAWRLSIPKGHYNILIEKRRSKAAVPVSRILWFSLILNMVLISFLGIKYYPTIKSLNVPVWNSFVYSNKPTIVFIGDFFGIMGRTVTGNYGWNRDFTINSEKDLFEYLEKNPRMNNRLEKANYSYMTGMGTVAVKNISEILHRARNEFSVRVVSSFSLEESKANNTIYIGPLRNENKFLGFFNRGNKVFKIEDLNLYYQNEFEGIDTTLNLRTSGINFEYAIVSKVEGVNDNSHMMFFSDHDMGVKATVEYFTNIDSVKAFSERHLKTDRNFAAIYEVRGEERTNLELNLLWVESY